MIQLSGVVERITYFNPENGYTVLRLRPENVEHHAPPGLDLSGLLTVVGNLPELSPGEQVRIEGDYTTHSKHGLQFAATKCEKILPITKEGIERYLGSGLIKGIGPGLAKRIVKHFGKDTLDIIENDPAQLRDVPGIGKDRSEKIIEAWDELRQIKEIMLFLHSHGISTNLAVKIYKTYGEQSIPIVKNNPYQLEEDIFGIGFKTADKIAQKLGLPKEHPSRIEAGILYALNQSVDEGHVYIEEKETINRTKSLLNVEAELINAGIGRLFAQERIRKETISKGSTATTDPLKENKTPNHNEEVIYYLPHLYHCECGVAECIHHLISHPSKPLQRLLIDNTENLSEEQENAIDKALKSPVSVITGGPGTGKTTCLKSLIYNLERNNIRYALVSPTGRAAKRLSEATGRPASTIHRLLSYNPSEGFKYHENNPLDLDYLIVDETSMLDIVLAYQLLRAVKPGSQLLLVGDVDQLPSVGAGDVLRHIIDSGKVPVSRLTTIFRQSENSEIIYNAHRINQGKSPVFSSSTSGDFFLFPAEEAQQASDWVIEVVTNRIPENFGLDPFKDIQVLTPIYRGQAGVDHLNEVLQAKLNPPGSQKVEQKLFGKMLRVGDKVMQIRNNYDKAVFNGDIGTIEDINRIDQNLTIKMDDLRVIQYDFSEADELVLAYAITVHKSQGSEFPAIVMPIITQHYIMLQRNLIYTGITRAMQLCVLIGNQKAIRIGLNNNQYMQRNSRLSDRITSAVTKA
jgi:exodeoxyribonuclease V alpha subunit